MMPPERQAEILAGDVGGTNTRLALFHADSTGRLRQAVEQVYPSREHRTLDEIVAKFLASHAPPEAQPDFGAIGIAGPIREGKSVATNLPWVVDSRSLSTRSGVSRLMLLNDLEANAFGIATLTPEDFELVRPGDASAAGNAAVISAGTGLGEAGMFWDGQNYFPFATEGGHASFAPEGEQQGELFQYLAKRFGHVSSERVLSGPGLQNIFAFLRDSRHLAVPAWLEEEMRTGDPAAAISRAAGAGRSDIAVEALELFVEIFGAEAGNLALKMLATGGVYLGGGIAPKISKQLTGDRFSRAFLEKGRMRPLLEAIPVRIILNDQAALRGAARGAWLKYGTRRSLQPALNP